LATNEFPTRAQAQTAAEDVLLALSKYDAPLAELAAAARRPLARFPIQYQTENPLKIPLPHLAELNRSGRVLQLRAIAELQAGKPEAAVADVKLILRLSESVRSEPFEMSALARLQLLTLAVQPIWEGIRNRQWSEAELNELSEALASNDLVSEWNYIIRGERAWNIATVEYWRRHPDESADFFLFETIMANIPDPVLHSMDSLPDLPEPLNRLWDRLLESWTDTTESHWLMKLLPDGWYDLNKVELAKDYQNGALTVADPAKHLLSRQKMQEGEEYLSWRHFVGARSPGSSMTPMLVSSFSFNYLRFASTQNALDLARVACALEIYRLHHGDYPVQLDALSPEIIAAVPPDVINGEPLHYRSLGNGRYQIYSIGWNGQDDNGKVGVKARGDYDPKVGDWVWEN
jgi:hypothetical protein